MQNADLIKTFYKAFADADAEKMVACYHDEIQFEDPAFGKLNGNDAKNMWRMLVERGKGNIKVDSWDIKATEQTGSAKWKAEYVYAATKRKVINNITASFKFKDGKIIQHTDDFDLWKWTQQALGVSGYLLGWSGFMKGKIQKQTNSLLRKYSEAKG